MPNVRNTRSTLYAEERAVTSKDEGLPLLGIQLAIFEVIWPAFRWIRKIWLSQPRLSLFIETSQVSIEQEERADFERLMGELLQAMASDGLHPIGTVYSVEYGLIPPADYAEIFSDDIFREVAKKHAPWRLDDGR